MKKSAIYLSGGGARGAYQAGVLKGISDIIKADKIPVDILSSVSAGSINAAYIAMHADDFKFAVTKLTELWSSLCCGKIFDVRNIALIKSVLRNFFEMLFHFKVKNGGYLLDTTPLKKLLDSNLDFKKINENIEKGLLSVFEVAVSCYDPPENISFFKSSISQPCWKKIRHVSSSTNIECQHILASAAMPLFFPAVKIDQLNFGDGGIRLNTPLRAAIKLGAEQILAISTRRIPFEVSIPVADENVSFAKILGSMLNALFLDNLDRDIELVEKINQSLHLIAPEKQAQSEWRHIEILYIHPSIDLGDLTQKMPKTLPILLRYLMSALGSKEQSSDLLSFLLFESTYCKELIEIGYQDALTQKDAVEHFFLR